MQRNEDLFREIAQRIREEPAAHDQTIWFHEDSCGTSACIAGWAVHLESMRNENVRVSPLSGVRIDGDYMGYEDAGRLLLGLTVDESERLFYAWDERYLKNGLTFPEVLEKIAAGDEVADLVSLNPEGDDVCSG